MRWPWVQRKKYDALMRRIDQLEKQIVAETEKSNELQQCLVAVTKTFLPVVKGEAQKAGWHSDLTVVTAMFVEPYHTYEEANVHSYLRDPDRVMHALAIGVQEWLLGEVLEGIRNSFEYMAKEIQEKASE